ncbi:unnamed protein product [Diatraea saccharalis]|uniref:Uncharacterized protein n=1 Tax=Diatraea saccharalis TaxID=40085 RepID=A0A9N9R862_9NEOP|nr:unnamed protein product [Diatraea saccharalis]
MLGLLRKQINVCITQLNVIETRHCRKALIILGVGESETDNCIDLVCNILTSRLGLRDVTKSFLTVCHRLGEPPNNGGRDQPVLVRFAQSELKSAAWTSKTKFKGTSIIVKEFLTKSRQAVFNKARLHCGVHCCWTQDGVIFIKTSDGRRHKCVTQEELDSLTAVHPKPHQRELQLVALFLPAKISS